MHSAIIIVAKYFVVIPVAALVFIFVRSSNSKRKDIIIFSFVSVLCAILLVKFATTIYQDPRPFISDGVKPYFTSSTDNGFPSDHTVFSALLALIVFKSSRRLGLVLLLIAILIGSARVLAGVHHGKDIVGGLIIAGLSYGLASLVIVVWSRLSKPPSQ